MTEKMFTPEMESKAKEEKPLKYVEADRDGKCSWCQGDYKEGDKIALYATKEERELDPNAKPSPYHTDCIDNVIIGESGKEKKEESI